MKKIIIAGLILFAQIAQATEFPFTLHKLKSGQPGPTLLVIGGIQGDEPGGFTAASMLVTDYKIARGEVWVVPNLNFESIIKRSRGVHGDMNRKFHNISDNDPQLQAIKKIKQIITDDQVDMV
jgi:predicted deacylase